MGADTMRGQVIMNQVNQRFRQWSGSINVPFELQAAFFEIDKIMKRWPRPRPKPRAAVRRACEGENLSQRRRLQTRSQRLRITLEIIPEFAFVRDPIPSTDDHPEGGRIEDFVEPRCGKQIGDELPRIIDWRGKRCRPLKFRQTVHQRQAEHRLLPVTLGWDGSRIHRIEVMATSP